MPFYDLRCAECEKEFNIMASMTDRTEQRIICPECGSINMEAVFKSAPNYVMKGKVAECPSSHICGAECRHSHGM